MSLTLPSIGGGFNATTVNDNFQTIQTYINDLLLHRDGLTLGQPNQLENTLDANSNQFINLPTPAYPTSPVRVQDLEGGEAAPIVGAAVITEAQTATEGQTVFTLATFTYELSVGSLAVYINGVRQAPSAYSETSTTVVTFSEGLNAGDGVVFVSADVVTTTIQNATSITYNSGTTVSAELDSIRSRLDALEP